MALVNYTGKNILGVCLDKGEIVRLLPGINEVEDAKLQQMQKHPLFQARVGKGMVIIMEPPKSGKQTESEMLGMIPQIVDVKLLKKIIDTDGRGSVVDAAKDQLGKIKNPVKAKSEANQNEHFS